MPALPVAGLNGLVNADPLGPLQLPPTSGVPPNCVNKFTEASVLHTTMLAFAPAFGSGFTDTVTVELADALPQAPEPTTVYV